MVNLLDLTKEEKLELIELYREKIRKLESQKLRYLELIGQLNHSAASPNQIEIPDLNSTPAGYDRTMSWSKKARFVLVAEKRPLTVRQIFDKLCLIEPALQENSRKNYEYLSSTISTKVASGKMFKRQHSPEHKSYLIELLDYSNE